MKCLGIALTLMFAMAWFTAVLSKEPVNDSGNVSEAAQEAESRPTDQPSLREARRQAATLHSAMHATLQAVHHRYYREDQGLPIPASILKDVFTEIEEEHRIKLRWLVVEGQAMNTDHQPQDAFEKEAVEALKSGKRKFERSENGVYRRAGAITLTSHCLKCHVPDRKNTKDRMAGLLISIPVKQH